MIVHDDFGQWLLDNELAPILWKNGFNSGFLFSKFNNMSEWMGQSLGRRDYGGPRGNG